MNRTGRFLLTLALVLALLSPNTLATARSPSEAEHAATRAALVTPRLDAAYEVRVNAGSPTPYTDLDGKVWAADQPYTPSSWGYVGGNYYSTALAIEETLDDPLYQSQHTNMSAYLFDVPNDVYEVELRFAEIYCTTPCRSFHVKIEGVQFLTSFAPLAAVGHRTAVNMTFLVPVNDNQLRIEFPTVTGQAVVNAIRVMGLDGQPPTRARINAGWYDYRDTQGNLWPADQAYLAGTRGYVHVASGTSKVTNDIANTDDDRLFQTQRYNMTGYYFDLQPGFYKVDLLLAETYSQVRPGLRVFDVYAEGSKVLSDVDVFLLAGGLYKAITLTFNIALADPTLNITFTKKVTATQPPAISAISVATLDTVQPTTSIASPSPGQIITTSPYLITGSASDDLSGVERVEVSTDNGVSWNTASGTTSWSYNWSPAADGDFTIRARAVDKAGNVDSVGASVNVTVDRTPPSSTITSPSAGYVSGPTFIIEGTAFDATSGVQAVEVSTDGGSSWNPAVGTTTWSYTWAVPGDGFYTLRSRARDNGGLTETPGPGVGVGVDNVPPTTIIATPLPGQVISATTFVMTGTAFDATAGVRRVEVSTDGGVTWITSTGTTAWSYTWPVGGDGSYTIRARAVDNALNTDSPGAAVNVLVDKTAPTSGITAPTPGQAIRGVSFVVSGTASDGSGSGLSRVEVSTDGANWMTASGLSSWTYNWILPSDGACTVRSRAVDLGGNVQTPPASVNVIVDNTPPSTVPSVAGTPGDGGWYISPITLTLTATDAGSGVASTSYRVSPGAWIAYTGPALITNNGNLTLDYYSVDQAGNVETTHSIAAAVDSVPPASSATFVGPVGSEGWYRGTVTITLSAADATSGLRGLFYSLEGGPFVTYTTPLVVSSDGTHALAYRATDNAGNVEATHAVTFTIDRFAPSTTASLVGTLGDGGWYISPISITLTASDAGSGILASYYRLSPASWFTYTAPVLWSANGIQTLEYYSVDRAGNTEAAHSQSVAIDTVAPTSSASLSGPLGNEGWYRGSVNAVLTGSDATSGLRSIFYRLDAAGWLTYTSPIAVSGEGTHALVHSARDNAGNGEAAHTTTIRIDTVPPTSTVTWPHAGVAISGTSFLVMGMSQDGSSGVSKVEISVDSGPFVAASGLFPWTYAWILPGNGPHNLRSRATDRAGNVETPSAGITVTVDNALPSSTIASPYNGQIINATSFVITGTATDAHAGIKRVEVSTNGGISWTQAIVISPSTWLFNWAVPGDGVYNLRSRAVDNADNVEIPSVGISVQVDRTSPQSFIVTPVNGEYIRGTYYTITGTASDTGSGIKRVQIQVDGDEWQLATGTTAWSYTWILPEWLTDGSHTIRSRATDNAGNIETPGTDVQIIVDQTKPTSTILMPYDGQTFTSSVVNIMGTSFDATSLVRRVHISLQRSADGFYWDGSAWSATETWLITSAPVTSWSYTWTGVPTIGEITIRSRATDNAGNIEVPGAGVRIRIRRGYDVFLPIVISGFSP